MHFCSTRRAVIYLLEQLGDWDFTLGIRAGRNSELLEIEAAIQDLLGDDLVATQAFHSYQVHKLQNYPFKKMPKLLAEP